MYRILFYHKPINGQPNIPPNDITLFASFTGVYSRNDIPFVINYASEPIKNGPLNKVLINKGEYFIQHPVSDILRIESFGEGIYIFLTNKGFWTVDSNIDMAEALLIKAGFFRVHKNHLVNVHHVQSFVKCDAFITLSNSESIPVTATNDKQILSFLKSKSIL
jgi:DNA-binding LytR/AlgR family response regulator